MDWRGVGIWRWAGPKRDSASPKKLHFHFAGKCGLSKIFNHVPNCHNASLNSSETLNFNLKEMNPKMCTVWLKPGSQSLFCTKTTISQRNFLQIQKNPENGIKKLQEKVRNKFNFFFFQSTFFLLTKKGDKEVFPRFWKPRTIRLSSRFFFLCFSSFLRIFSHFSFAQKYRLFHAPVTFFNYD